MKITHLSTYDLRGGAGRAAFRLHQGLASLGEESSFVALYKDSSDPSVVCFDPPRNLWKRLRRRLKRGLLRRTETLIQSRPSNSKFFSDDRSQHNADVLHQLPTTDVLNVHWINGLFDFTSFFREVPKTLPIVWTLHDMNPITGGCHHAAECVRFQCDCGKCPQLFSDDQDDLSHRIWRRKDRAYSSLRPELFNFVTPSRWLAGKVRQSSLAKSFALSVIPYGLDTQIFKPLEKFLVRDALGIPRDAKVILFMSYFSRDNFKGFSFLAEALRGIQHIPKLRLVSAGEGRVGIDQLLGVPRHSLGLLREEELLAQVYNSADLLILPSLQDNFPNSALEALACGLPVVGFDVGGVPEIVRNDCTGMVVPAGNALALGRAFTDLLQDDGRRNLMSRNCRRIAVEEFSLQVQAKGYVDLYASLASARG